MYLTTYKITENVISDELCWELLELAAKTNIKKSFIFRCGTYIQILGHINDVAVKLLIHSNTKIEYWKDYKQETISSIQKIIHMINESQWNISPLIIPSHTQNVIIKINDDDKITISEALFINDTPKFFGKFTSNYDDDYDIGFCWCPPNCDEEIMFEIDSSYIGGWLPKESVVI